MTARQSLRYPDHCSLAKVFRRKSGFAIVVGLLLMLTGLGPVVKAANLDEHPVTSSYLPAWFKLSFLDLKQDLAEAGAAGKQGIMVLFSIRGCAYCKMLVERSLKDPAIETTLRRHFDVIHLDIHSALELKDLQGRAMPIKAFATREGASFSPTVAFYGLDGLHLIRIVGYQTPERFRTTLSQAIGILDQAKQLPIATESASRK